MSANKSTGFIVVFNGHKYHLTANLNKLLRCDGEYKAKNELRKK